MSNDYAKVTVQYARGRSHLSLVLVDGKVLPVTRFEIKAEVHSSGELVLSIPMDADLVELTYAPDNGDSHD
jgi:hypothetical protein